MSNHDISSPETHSVRGYIYVFLALIAGTVLTVWASFIHFGSAEINIAVALTIASVKAFLVVAYFMHLISERKMIYLVLGFTAFFFAALMGLTVWSLQPNSLIHMQ
jgi:cytochrome c oxidase subunit 4